MIPIHFVVTRHSNTLVSRGITLKIFTDMKCWTLKDHKSIQQKRWNDKRKDFQTRKIIKAELKLKVLFLMHSKQQRSSTMEHCLINSALQQVPRHITPQIILSVNTPENFYMLIKSPNPHILSFSLPLPRTFLWLENFFK